MELEQEAKAFVQGLHALFFEHRDIAVFADLLDARISWIGMGRSELCGDAAALLACLEAQRRVYVQPLKIVQRHYEALRLAEKACLVYGTLGLWPLDGIAARLDLRFSAICREEAQDMKLLHMHMSLPDFDQEDGEGYVSKRTRAGNRELRCRVAQATQELQLRNGALEVMLENLPGSVHCCREDEVFTLVHMSDSFLAMFGYTREEIAQLFQNRYINMIYPKDRALVRKALAAQLDSGNLVEVEYRIVTREGDVRWIYDQGRRAVSETGAPVFYCMLQDITARRKEREEARLLMERYKVIMDQTSDIVFEWDVQRDKMFFSDHWQHKFGNAVLRENMVEMVPQSARLHPEDKPKFVAIMEAIKQGTLYNETDFRMKNKVGEYIWCRMRSTTQFDDAGRPVKAIGVIADIDTQKREQERLLWQAEQDALTELYNKSATKHHVERLLREAKEAALLIIDVDDFKGVNDRFGHLCGDAVLVEIARHLRHLLRVSDVVGRIGGDEFLVFLPYFSDAAGVAEKAREVLRAFERIAVGGNAQCKLGCSIGIALYPRDAAGYTELYRCADQALYHAKAQGKRSFAFYEKAECQMPIPRKTAHFVKVPTELAAQMEEVDQTLLQYVFQMLYNSLDTERMVRQILEIVGKAYDVSRVYIFENSPDDLFCNNTFEWCNDGVAAEIENLQHISYEKDLGGYLDNFDEDGVFYCSDIKALHPLLYGVLAPQGIVSLLQCAILDDGHFKGYVGFDECRTNRYWTKSQINTLALISKALSTFLLKLRYKEQLAACKLR